MEQHTAEAFGSPDRQGLLRLLAYCGDKARVSGEPVLLSISLPGSYLDPLAVLQTVWDPSKVHYFLESRRLGCSVSCAEPVLDVCASGPDRFAAVRRASENWFRNAVCVGEMSLPFSGPHVFCSFAFEDESDGRFLPAAYAFLPRWQVASRGNSYCAVANVVVDSGTDHGPVADSILRAYGRFSSFDFSGSPDETADPTPSRNRGKVTGSDGLQDDGFLDEVRHVLRSIEAGQVEKVVLARWICLRLRDPVEALDLVDLLRQRFADCHSFALYNGRGGHLVGASPERLLSVRGRALETEALAGSIARGGNARADAGLSRQLLGDAKELEENALVIRFLVEQLAGLGVKVRFADIPEIMALPHIQHLRIPVSGELPEHLHLMDLAAALHPTPALGGYPREKALAMISALEQRARGPYAGLSGWFNCQGDGDLLVHIRCALMTDAEVALPAGAGIVRGSDPAKELEETDLKMRGLRDLLECERHLEP